MSTTEEAERVCRELTKVANITRETSRDIIARALDRAVLAERERMDDIALAAQHLAIGQAILAEREACAKVAEDDSILPAPESDADGEVRDVDPRPAVAAAIRSRK